jgi:hypothetical protein
MKSFVVAQYGANNQVLLLLLTEIKIEYPFCTAAQEMHPRCTKWLSSDKSSTEGAGVDDEAEKVCLVCLPCLLLLMIPILPRSDLGWETAIGAVFVIVVMVAAGIIRVDMLIPVVSSFKISSSYLLLMMFNFHCLFNEMMMMMMMMIMMMMMMMMMMMIMIV